MALGTTFFAKSRIFGEFGVPGRFLGTALGRILAGKNWDEKNDEKKVAKVVASAGDADPGQDPPAGFFRKIRHAFAHPNGWAGGLFALRVPRRGPLEAGRLEKIKGGWSFGRGRGMAGLGRGRDR